MKAGLSSVAKRVLWTAALAGALLVLDSWVGGPRVPPGWRRVSDMKMVPVPPGPPWMPSYLPQTLGGAPAQVWVRTDPPAGWWLRFDDASGPALWVGTESGPPPQSLVEALECVGGDAGCPAPWSKGLRARQGQDGLLVLTRLGEQAMTRVLHTLRAEEP